LGALDLLNVLRRKPFEPFRIITRDGVVYDVRHPELVILTATGAVVGYPDPARPGLAERFDLIGLEHVVRVEQLPRAAAKPNGQ
jgi:hypothetical protein